VVGVFRLNSQDAPRLAKPAGPVATVAPRIGAPAVRKIASPRSPAPARAAVLPAASGDGDWETF